MQTVVSYPVCLVRLLHINFCQFTAFSECSNLVLALLHAMGGLRSDVTPCILYMPSLILPALSLPRCAHTHTHTHRALYTCIVMYTHLGLELRQFVCSFMFQYIHMYIIGDAQHPWQVCTWCVYMHYIHTISCMYVRISLAPYWMPDMCTCIL